MTKQRESKPIIPIMLDCETLSLSHNAAVIEVALVPFDRWEWPSKVVQIDPTSYKGTSFDIDQSTIEFHQKQGTNILERCTVQGKSWKSSAFDILDWFNDMRAYDLHIWCQGKDVDIPWLSNLLKQAGIRLPWHYTHTHCLRDLTQQYRDISRAYYGNHTALKDCQAQIKHIQDIAKGNKRVAEWIWGPESVPPHLL
jgi:hypothetical protein